jgi:hypothetical protein
MRERLPSGSADAWLLPTPSPMVIGHRSPRQHEHASKRSGDDKTSESDTGYALKVNMMAEVVTLGECMAVLYPPESIPIEHAETLLLGIGGAETNLVIRLQRMGHTARFISHVGDDPFGRRIIGTLAVEGVDTSFVTVDATRRPSWRSRGRRAGRLRRTTTGANV